MTGFVVAFALSVAAVWGESPGRPPDDAPRVRVYTAPGSAESPPPPLTLSVGRFQLIEVDVPKPDAVLWLVQPESARANTAACRELPPGTKIHGTLEGHDSSQLHAPTSDKSGLLYLEGKAAGRFQLTAVLNGQPNSRPEVLFTREVVVGGAVDEPKPDGSADPRLASSLREALAEDPDPLMKKKEHAAALGQIYAEAAKKFDDTSGGTYQAVHGWLLEQSYARGVAVQYDLDGTLLKYLPKLRAAIAQYAQFPDTGAAWTPELRAAVVARFRVLGATLKEVTK